MSKLIAIIGQPSNGGGGAAVDSVNGKTGTVVLDAADVGAVESVVGGANITVDNTCLLYTSPSPRD